MKLEVLRERDFAIYMSGNLASWTGLWIQRIAIGWLSWELSHSAAWVGLVSFAQFGPVIVLGPLFGVLADKLERRRYAIVASSIQMGIATALFVVAAMGWMTIELLCALCFCTGVTTSAYQPVRLALVNDLSPRPLLTQAIAIHSLIFNLTRFVGPALGGVVIASAGTSAPFAINAFAYLALIAALSVIRLRPSEHKKASGEFFAEMRAGFGYVREHRNLVHIFALGLISNFLGRGVLELLPVFAEAVFAAGASGLATLTAATGVGSILSAGIVTRARHPAQLPRLGRRSIYVSSLLLVALGLTPWYLPGIMLCFALGFTLTLTGVSLQVALQSLVHDTFRGRIVGLWGVVVTGGSAVGGAVIGAFSQLAGLGTVTVACGVAGVAGWNRFRAR
mgnify:CR=1 FL=1